MSFFLRFHVDISQVPSEVPFQTIVKCFRYDPAHRPTIEEIYAEPYFQARSLTDAVRAELAGLVSRL